MERLNDDRSRSVEGIAAICVSVGGVEPEDRDRLEGRRLGEAELDWIFNYCYGLYTLVAVCATYTIDEDFAGHTKGAIAASESASWRTRRGTT